MLLASILLSTRSAPVAGQSLADRLKAVQGGQALPISAVPQSPAIPPPPVFKPFTGAVPAPTIPLVKDLLVTAARADPPHNDWEWVDVITQTGPTEIRSHFSAIGPKPDDAPRPASDPAPQHPLASCDVIDDVTDLARAMSLYQRMCETPVVHNPGMLQARLSTAAYDQLRAGRDVDFHIPVGGYDFLQRFVPNGQKSKSGVYAGQPQYACSLHRDSTVDVAVPVLVNNAPVELPALRVRVTCPDSVRDADGNGAGFTLYILDQQTNPLWLAADSASGAMRSLQVVKISFPLTVPAGVLPPLEVALARHDAVPIYGIYFDFDSDAIKPESEKVLAEIAQIMGRNPDWRLSLSGHTDNIGSASANLALSQRRTAAVKAALITRFHISAQRLTTDGYGASRPIAPNETYEGRARNRRVELQRL